MRQTSRATLYDRAAGDYVDVDFIDGVTWEEVVDAQSAWRPAMKELLAKLQQANIPRARWPEHAHWDWQLKFLMGQAEGLRLFGIRHELLIQGLMMLKPVASSKLIFNLDANLVYVDYLASAPWNLTYEGVQRGRFGQVGRVFLAAAVQL